MIQYTILSQHDDKYAPPDQDVLKVATVGDIAFLSIGQHRENATEVTFTEGEGSSHADVDALDLIVSVFNGCSSDAREQIRRVIEEQRLADARTA